MSNYKGNPPISIRYWIRPLKSQPGLCRVLAAIYFRATKKRLYINLPGFFDPKTLDGLNNRIFAFTPGGYEAQAPAMSKVFKWEYAAASAIDDLLSRHPASEITKPMLDAAITEMLKKADAIIP